jgi:hypothetical protein
MPVDPHGHDDEDLGLGEGQQRRFGDFDCPDCAANNPYDDPFGDGDEIRCFYCGQEFRVTVTEEGRLKVRAV